MEIKKKLLLSLTWLSVIVFGAHDSSDPFADEAPDIVLPSVQYKPTKSAVDKEDITASKAVAMRVINALEKDFEDNVQSSLRSRWVFRKSANVAEILGNGFLYCGSGISTIAAAVNLIGSQNISNILLFTAAGCFAAHIVFIGFAKCFAREEKEREKQLEALAKKVGFSVTHMECTITDDAAGAAADEKTAQI